MNRRVFLKGTAAAAGAVAFPYIVPSSVLGKAGDIAPSNKIVMGCIGMGIQGPGDMQAFLGNADVQVVAVCDVRATGRAKGKNLVNRKYGNEDCAVYGDFRQMLARHDIDAILTAPPDHWHAVIGVEAARHGKDMYYEKPMGIAVRQSQATREAVNRHGVIFQFGTQQRSEANFRFACELVRNGRIGRLHTIVVAVPPSISWPNLQPEPIEEDIDYDMWLGPAPWVPYNYERCRPYVSRPREPWTSNYSLWYHIRDYCLGFVANWGIHHLDIAQWGHGTDDTGPVEVEGTGVISRDGVADTATQWEVEMKYTDGVKLIYIDSEHSRPRYGQLPEHGRGILFFGDEGWVAVARDGFLDSNPKSLLNSRIRPDEINLVNSTGHHRNFLDSVKTRKPPACPIEASVRSDTLAHLADISMRLGRKLRWDPQRELFVDDDDANKMLDRPMRSPWHL
jgi:predicted dehydrogenase